MPLTLPLAFASTIARTCAVLLLSVAALVLGSPAAIAQASLITPPCTPDWVSSFGAVPAFNFNAHADAIATFDSGSGPQLYVGGSFTSIGNLSLSRIARWDGKAWTQLGTGVDSTVNTFCVYNDGSGPALFVGGNFTVAGGIMCNHIARWDGAAWASVGGGVSSEVRDLEVFNGKLYATGYFSTAGAVMASRIASWNGSTWAPLGTGLSSSRGDALVTYDDGAGPALYVGGDFATAGGISTHGIAKWDGFSWSALGTGFNDVVLDLAVYDDGTGSGPALYAGGFFTTAGGISANRIAMWSPIAHSWSQVGTGMNSSVWALCVHNDGTGPALYAGGFFNSAAGNHVSRWDGATWSPLGSGLDNASYSLGTYDDGHGEALIAGGPFGSAGEIDQVYGIAQWRAHEWRAVGTGFSNTVLASCNVSDGPLAGLYVGGDFLIAGAYGANHVAKVSGGVTTALGLGMPGILNTVSSLSAFDDGSGLALYAGGTFGTAGSVSVNNFAKWNGATWLSVPGLNNRISALMPYDPGAGVSLYAAGLFTGTYSHIARKTATGWATLGSGLNGNGNALNVYNNGSVSRLIVGGTFTSAGGVAANNIAAWDGANWTALGAGLNGAVNALAVIDLGSGPRLYAGGAFTLAGGVTAARIAGWDGTSWFPLGVGVNNAVNAICAHDDGTGVALYAGGSFTLAGGGAASRIARWNGVSWSALGPGQPDLIQTLCVHDDGIGAGTSLYAGGPFTNLPPADSYLAVWGCSDGAGSAYCFGDGSGHACPCSNAGTSGNGCANSVNPNGASLSGSGAARLSSDSYILAAVGMPNSSALYFQGTTPVSGGGGAPFGDGLRCVAGSIIRLGVKSNVSGASHYPAVGDSSISIRGLIGSPGTRTYQVWYRNADATYCTSATFNLANGLSVVWMM
jgi:trimeric autotransporter adhesin